MGRTKEVPDEVVARAFSPELLQTCGQEGPGHDAIPCQKCVVHTSDGHTGAVLVTWAEIVAAKQREHDKQVAGERAAEAAARGQAALEEQLITLYRKIARNSEDDAWLLMQTAHAMAAEKPVRISFGGGRR